MGRFYPRYHVYLSSGFSYLISAKKRSGNKTSNYLMSMDKNNLDRKSPGFLGKVRSNFLGMIFINKLLQILNFFINQLIINIT